MTVDEYIKRLEQHDWLYIMSEDPARYWAGNREHNELIRLSNDSPEFRRLFRQYHDINYASVKGR